MQYSLLYTKTAVKDIKKLDIVAQKRLKKKLELLASDPLHYSKKLVHSDLGTYRYRVGDYRIVFDLEGKEIIILRVGHRREIYK
ncbi:type II toxin-antitoxin system RelE/ParE family toxin [Candidatus Woesebacteria bacterium]|nr:type II toxin-antitoxin system RelE/ParE family toxin [Candidatus Woesebacteria bacterium]